VARDHGARGVLLYHPHASSVQAVAPDTHLPLPAATIGRGAATALAREGGAARLDVESEETNLSLENMFVRRGEGPLHVVAVAHYDSRPRRLGPAARSLGLAAMLSLLDTVKPPADRRITFALLDGEEFGSVGRARYYEDVRKEAVEPPDLVVDLNALGTRRDLGLEVHFPRGESRGLQDFALRTFEAAGLHLVPRELDRGFYGGTPGLRAGCPVLALGGRPRPRVPCGDPEHGIPDRWGVSHLVGPITTLLYGARP
jgi:peptidase M28-like protein